MPTIRSVVEGDDDHVLICGKACAVVDGKRVCTKIEVSALQFPISLGISRVKGVESHVNPCNHRLILPRRRRNIDVQIEAILTFSSGGWRGVVYGNRGVAYGFRIDEFLNARRTIIIS